MFDLEQNVWEFDYAVDTSPVRVERVEPRALVQPGFQLPARLWSAMFALYAVFFVAMAGVVGGKGPGLFMVAISAIYAIVYFGTASVLANLPGAADRSPLDEGRPLQTWCGPMSGHAVYGQVLIVPLAVEVFGVSFAFLRWAL